MAAAPLPCGLQASAGGVLGHGGGHSPGRGGAAGRPLWVPVSTGPYQFQPVLAAPSQVCGGPRAGGGNGSEPLAPLRRPVVGRAVSAVLREQGGQSRRGEETEGETMATPEQVGRGEQQPRRLARLGRGGTALKGLLLLLEEAQGMAPVFLHCSWAQGQSLPGGQSIMCGEATEEQKVGKRGLAEARSVFPVCPFLCLSTRIKN